MKVFVAGATGVLGRRAVRLLVEAGHTVSGVARSPGKANLLRSLGATPVAVDLFDAAAVTAAVAGHDVVCNLATHIPDLRHSSRPDAWAETARLRTEASRHLVDAAIAAGASVYIQESVAFLYADGGDRWIDEDAPIGTNGAGGPVAAAEAEARRFAAAGGTGIALRFGFFYGPGSSHTADQIRLARHGVAPSVGAAEGYQSMIHLDDAGAAVVAAVRAPSGTYHVVEDEPATRAAQADAVAAALGLGRLRPLPAALTRFGGAATASMTRSVRASNARFRAATGWAPAHPDQASGWAQVAAALPPPSPSDAGRRFATTVALVFLAVTAAVEGLWATFAPSSFYGRFPGSGHWVAAYPPYNEHLVRDVGDLALALLVLTLGALVIGRRSVVRLTGLAWLVEGIPHLLFHVLNRGALDGGQTAASLIGLAFAVVLALVCVVVVPPDPTRRYPVAWSAPPRAVASASSSAA